VDPQEEQQPGRPLSRRDILHACAGYVLAQPRPSPTRRKALRLSESQLCQMAALISAAPDGGGAGVGSLLAQVHR